MNAICETTSRRWLTRLQAAEYLTLSPSQFDNLCKAGRIQIARVGRRILVDRLWLDDRLASGGL
jgi:excisionase family DNA binding protein